MTIRDLLLIGIPLLAGWSILGYSLAPFLRNRPRTDDVSLYRSAHRRMAERLIDGNLLPFPGACLVNSLRPWIAGESAFLALLLAGVGLDRTAWGSAQCVVAGLLVGSAVAWFSFRDESRRALLSVQRDLPTASILLSLLLESGMGASSALQEATSSVPEGPLARELAELVRARSMGVPRAETIDRSKRRVPLEEYRLFLNHILQGERLGIGLSRSLRELSGRMLENQGHRAETIAQQAGVKMLFPLVVFIFPAVFLIILSPILLGLWNRVWG